MAEFDPGAGFMRDDGYEPPSNDPFVFLEVRGDEGRIHYRGWVTFSGEPRRLGEIYDEEVWTPVEDAKATARDCANRIDLHPIPWRSLG